MVTLSQQIKYNQLKYNTPTRTERVQAEYERIKDVRRQQVLQGEIEEKVKQYQSEFSGVTTVEEYSQKYSQLPEDVKQYFKTPQEVQVDLEQDRQRNYQKSLDILNEYKSNLDREYKDWESTLDYLQLNVKRARTDSERQRAQANLDKRTEQHYQTVDKLKAYIQSWEEGKNLIQQGYDFTAVQQQTYQKAFGLMTAKPKSVVEAESKAKQEYINEATATVINNYKLQLSEEYKNWDYYEEKLQQNLKNARTEDEKERAKTALTIEQARHEYKTDELKAYIQSWEQGKEKLGSGYDYKIVQKEIEKRAYGLMTEDPTKIILRLFEPKEYTSKEKEYNATFLDGIKKLFGRQSNEANEIKLQTTTVAQEYDSLNKALKETGDKSNFKKVMIQAYGGIKTGAKEFYSSQMIVKGGTIIPSWKKIFGTGKEIIDVNEQQITKFLDTYDISVRSPMQSLVFGFTPGQYKITKQGEYAGEGYYNVDETLSEMFVEKPKKFYEFLSSKKEEGLTKSAKERLEKEGLIPTEAQINRQVEVYNLSEQEKYNREINLQINTGLLKTQQDVDLWTESWQMQREPEFKKFTAKINANYATYWEQGIKKIGIENINRGYISTLNWENRILQDPLMLAYLGAFPKTKGQMATFIPKEFIIGYAGIKGGSLALKGASKVITKVGETSAKLFEEGILSKASKVAKYGFDVYLARYVLPPAKISIGGTTYKMQDWYKKLDTGGAYASDQWLLSEQVPKFILGTYGAVSAFKTTKNVTQEAWARARRDIGNVKIDLLDFDESGNLIGKRREFVEATKIYKGEAGKLPDEIIYYQSRLSKAGVFRVPKFSWTSPNTWGWRVRTEIAKLLKAEKLYKAGTIYKKTSVIPQSFMTPFGGAATPIHIVREVPVISTKLPNMNELREFKYRKWIDFLKAKGYKIPTSVYNPKLIFSDTIKTSKQLYPKLRATFERQFYNKYSKLFTKIIKETTIVKLKGMTPRAQLLYKDMFQTTAHVSRTGIKFSEKFVDAQGKQWNVFKIARRTEEEVRALEAKGIHLRGLARKGGVYTLPQTSPIEPSYKQMVNMFKSNKFPEYYVGLPTTDKSMAFMFSKTYTATEWRAYQKMISGKMSAKTYFEKYMVPSKKMQLVGTGELQMYLAPGTVGSEKYIITPAVKRAVHYGGGFKLYADARVLTEKELLHVFDGGLKVGKNIIKSESLLKANIKKMVGEISFSESSPYIARENLLLQYLYSGSKILKSKPSIPKSSKLNIPSYVLNEYRLSGGTTPTKPSGTSGSTGLTVPSIPSIPTIPSTPDVPSYPFRPRERPPTYIVPWIFDLPEGRGKRKRRRKKSIYGLYYLPSFTARALGLEPIKLSKNALKAERQAERLINKLESGLEIRRGVKFA